MAIAVTADVSFIENLLFWSNDGTRPWFLPERIAQPIIELHPLDARSDRACEN